MHDRSVMSNMNRINIKEMMNTTGNVLNTRRYMFLIQDDKSFNSSLI